MKLATEKKIAVRGGWDRVRYAVSFEVILIVLVGSILSLLSGRKIWDTGALATVLSLVALVGNVLYNYAVDFVDVHFDRIPTERSVTGRMAHAVGLELTLVVLNLPIFIWWLDWQWWQALAFDVATMAFVVVYTYFFTLAYDRAFPIAQPARSPASG